MRRRRFVQAFAALPAAPALVAQQGGYGTGGADQLPKPDAYSVPDAAAEPVRRFFGAPQFAALRRLSDLILPRIGETPGALDARAPEFLDFLIAESPADRKQLYRAGLDALNAQSTKRFAKPFADIDATQANELLAPLRERWTYTDPPATLPAGIAAFLRAAKADILLATTNSREWIDVVSKRTRNAGGVSLFWRPIA